MYDIQYRAGNIDKVADALSRNPPELQIMPIPNNEPIPRFIASLSNNNSRHY